MAILKFKSTFEFNADGEPVSLYLTLSAQTLHDAELVTTDLKESLGAWFATCEESEND